VVIPLIVFLVIPVFGVVWWQSFDPRESDFLNHDRFSECELAIFSGDDGVCLRAEQAKNLDWSSVETCEQTEKIIKCPPATYPTLFTTSPERCAELFDRIFDTWKQHVKENYGGPGQPTLEPPTVAGLISGWEGGEGFRNTDCRFSVDNWGYLVEHQEQVWDNVDWPKLEPFKYVPPKYGDAWTVIEVFFGESYEDKLLPITIREATRHATDFDEIKVWHFGIIKNTVDTPQFEYWNIVPDEDAYFDVVGGNFESIIDESRLSPNSTPSIGFNTDVDCGELGTKQILTGIPATIPIKRDNFHVYAEHKDIGIYPDENGVYSLKMILMFDINNKSKENLTMLSETHQHCSWIDDLPPYLDPEYPVEPTYVEWKFRLD
jgi:hypothetical protein